MDDQLRMLYNQLASMLRSMSNVDPGEIPTQVHDVPLVGSDLIQILDWMGRYEASSGVMDEMPEVIGEVILQVVRVADKIEFQYNGITVAVLNQNGNGMARSGMINDIAQAVGQPTDSNRRAYATG